MPSKSLKDKLEELERAEAEATEKAELKADYSSPIERATRMVARGLLQDFADNAAAAGGTLYDKFKDSDKPMSKAYDDNLRRYRMLEEMDEQDFPIASMVGNIGGSSVLPIARTAKGAATMGGIQSLGAGNADTLIQELEDIVSGAALGSVGHRLNKVIGKPKAPIHNIADDTKPASLHIRPVDPTPTSDEFNDLVKVAQGDIITRKKLSSYTKDLIDKLNKEEQTKLLNTITKFEKATNSGDTILLDIVNSKTKPSFDDMQLLIGAKSSGKLSPKVSNEISGYFKKIVDSGDNDTLEYIANRGYIKPDSWLGIHPKLDKEIYNLIGKHDGAGNLQRVPAHLKKPRAVKLED